MWWLVICGDKYFFEVEAIHTWMVFVLQTSFIYRSYLMESQKPVFGENGQGSLYFSEEKNINEIVEITKRRLQKLNGHSVKFLCIVGIARSGTTILQVLASQLHSVICSEFQPLKYLLRYGEDKADSFMYNRFSINGNGGTIILKETLGPERSMECTLDPVGVLMQAGVPACDISAIYILRHPLKAFNSWYSLMRNSHPSKYIISQEFLIASYRRYLLLLPNCIPFCYEILEHDAKNILDRLFRKLGVLSDGEMIDLELDERLVKSKNCWNEGNRPHYWDGVIAPIVGRRRFEYVDRPIPDLPSEYAQSLSSQAVPQYLDFMKLTKEILNMK